MWIFQLLKVVVEKQSGIFFLKTLRIDRGGKFSSDEFTDYCKKNDIHRKLTTSNNPHHNGDVEQKNRTIVEMARSMLKRKSLPNIFWA